MVRASSLALALVLTACGADVFGGSADRSAALDADSAANGAADDDDDDSADDSGDGEGEADIEEGEDGGEGDVLDVLDDGRGEGEGEVSAGEGEGEAFTRFHFAGSDVAATADACAVGCDEGCAVCNATSLGPVCGAPVGRGALCLQIADAVVSPIDGPPACGSSVAACADGLDCLAVSSGFAVWGQCLPTSGHVEGEVCGADADCVDGLRCVAVGIIGGTCQP